MDKEEKFWFTVGQLTEILKEMPQDLPVVVSGYESGYENFFRPHIAELTHDPDNDYYDGEFQHAEKSDKNTFKAVILQRVVRDD